MRRSYPPCDGSRLIWGPRATAGQGRPKVADYADLAHLAHVSRARITQIMNLLLLAPDIQEAILFLPRTDGRGAPVRERLVRPIAAVPDWRKQRRMWCDLVNLTQVQQFQGIFGKFRGSGERNLRC